jgi:hypothetical protein
MKLTEVHGRACRIGGSIPYQEWAGIGKRRRTLLLFPKTNRPSRRLGASCAEPALAAENMRDQVARWAGRQAAVVDSEGGRRVWAPCRSRRSARPWCQSRLSAHERGGGQVSGADRAAPACPGMAGRGDDGEVVVHDDLAQRSRAARAFGESLCRTSRGQQVRVPLRAAPGSRADRRSPCSFRAPAAPGAAGATAACRASGQRGAGQCGRCGRWGSWCAGGAAA